MLTSRGCVRNEFLLKAVRLDKSWQKKSVSYFGGFWSKYWCFRVWLSHGYWGSLSPSVSVGRGGLRTEEVSSGVCPCQTMWRKQQGCWYGKDNFFFSSFAPSTCLPEHLPETSLIWKLISALSPKILQWSRLKISCFLEICVTWESETCLGTGHVFFLPDYEALLLNECLLLFPGKWIHHGMAFVPAWSIRCFGRKSCIWYLGTDLFKHVGAGNARN